MCSQSDCGRTEYRHQKFEGERALFASANLYCEDCVFDNGESPLKESHNLELERCLFRWKYPFWYCSDVVVRDSYWFDMARAGVWYTDRFSAEHCVVQAPKNFRRCRQLVLRDVTFTHAEETLWNCNGVELEHVTAAGDYFAMGTDHIRVNNLTLDGNYPFDGCHDVVIENSRLMSKDAFWNCDNVLVRGCYITGEYLAWNSTNVTLEDCTIESLQGLCYVKNLTMRNCRLVNTTLAFEYSTVNAEITGDATSILNPLEGTITAEHIGELIIEPDRVDPSRITICCNDIDRKSDRVVFPD